MDLFVKMQPELSLLNDPDPKKRIENLKKLLARESAAPEKKPEYANNHIHTIYSFSPYSPTAAVYMARVQGLETCGIVDHDSIGGAKEFRLAGQIAGMGTTCGMECRVDFSKTSLKGRRINNPDQPGIAYMAIHSVPADKIDFLQNAFAPYREKRNNRNRKMVANINELMAPYGIGIDFDADVLPISQYANGGTVTERHLLYALSLKIIGMAGKKGCADFVENKLNIALSEKQSTQLSDEANPHIAYDLLGVMKANLVERIYIPATDECMELSRAVSLSKEAGAVLAYAYLGDVTASVTGDKKAQKFEDEYLPELFETLKENGVNAVTYMPARNTKEQLKRVQDFCKEYGMTEISGEDVNSSRQSMICEQLKDAQYRHLVDMAWKLVDREKAFPAEEL